MALPLITAVRACRDLKESVLHTALEIAHRTSIYGVARVSYRYLAKKCHCSRQTIINHVKILVARGILRKTVRWIKNTFCDWNTYTFTIPWHTTPAHMCNDQKIGRNLPTQEKREKSGSVREEIAQLTKGLRYLDMTPGSLVYTATMERLAYLEGLLQTPGRDDPRQPGPASGTEEDHAPSAARVS
jgi:DNA-binding transcriptional MocR family regulator